VNQYNLLFVVCSNVDHKLLSILKHATLTVKYFQVSFEPDKWSDVPVEQNRHIESSFCKPYNDVCIVQVHSAALSASKCVLFLMILILHPFEGASITCTIVIFWQTSFIIASMYNMCRCLADLIG